MTPTPDQFEAAGLPVRLRIPAIDVDAPIEHVGLKDNNEMDVPKIARDVAWFKYGPLPGQVGNAVINGHLDQATSKAVFFKLRQLIVGDEMVVTYSNGDEYVFVVDEKSRYGVESSPMGLITGPTNERRMNLITCDGAWDRGAANYSQRLVIFTHLKGGSPGGGSVQRVEATPQANADSPGGNDRPEAKVAGTLEAAQPRSAP
jgi:LPXTG-site transpeptidase (sortase) family protein